MKKQGEWNFWYEYVKMNENSDIKKNMWNNNDFLWFCDLKGAPLSASVDPSVVNVQSAQCLHCGKLWMCTRACNCSFFFFCFFFLSLLFCVQSSTISRRGWPFYSFILLSLVCKVGGAEEVWEQMEVPVVFEPPCISIGQFLVWTNGDWSYEMIHDSTRNYTFRWLA